MIVCLTPSQWISDDTSGVGTTRCEHVQDGRSGPRARERPVRQEAAGSQQHPGLAPGLEEESLDVLFRIDFQGRSPPDPIAVVAMRSRHWRTRARYEAATSSVTETPEAITELGIDQLQVAVVVRLEILFAGKCERLSSRSQTIEGPPEPASLQ